MSGKFDAPIKAIRVKPTAAAETPNEYTTGELAEAMIAAAAGGDTEGVKALGKLAETLNAKGTK